MDNTDEFDDLDALRLSPGSLAAANSAMEAREARPRRQKRLAGDFYLCPVSWADRATAAVTGKAQLIIAFRLYRCWRLRKQGEDIIVASNAAVVGPGASREAKRRALYNLEAAGLIEVVERHAARAARIRIIETRGA